MFMRLLILALITFTFTSCGFRTGSPGHGIVFDSFGRVEEKCYPAGFYMYNPFTTSSHSVNLQEQKYEIATEAGSHDLQVVKMNIAVNFMVDPEKCWIVLRDLGEKFVDRVLLPEMLDVSKGVASAFPADKIIQDRISVKSKIEDALRLRLAKHPFIVRAVSITNIQFSKEYEKAIEEKQVADQHVKKALYTKQQAEVEAETVIAKASGEARANKLLQESYKQSPELLQARAIERWGGGVPLVIGGSGSIPFINIPISGQEKK